MDLTYVVLSDVLFASDDWNISQVGLDRIATFVDEQLRRDHPDFIHISVHGHTDCRGSDNETLSLKRASAAIEALANLQVDPNRIGPPEGFGCTQPVPPVPGRSDKETNRLNRRVEFIVTIAT